MDAASNQIAPKSVDARAARSGPVAATSLEVLHQLGRRAPVEGGTVRLTLVGQTTYFRSCALEQPINAVEPTFVDFRAGADAELMLVRVQASKPHVVIVFRPELIPA